jgi:hypothetical protein
MIECDERAFGPGSVSEVVGEEFKTYLSRGKFDGELWLRRAQALYDLLETPSYQNVFGLKGAASKDVLPMIRGIVRSVFDQFIAFGCETKKVTLDVFDTKFVILIGLELILGLGVDSKSMNVEAFKSWTRESPEYKVHFIVTSANLEDTYQIRTSFTHVVCSDLLSSMINQLKILDDYPSACSSVLGVYYNASWEVNKCRKFKKMKLNGEV